MIKVVIVDDEDWNREIVKTFGEWERLGMEIVGEANDGSEAVRIIERLSPQIVVTDMRMPGADGVELLGILNERFPEIKAIVVSGYDDFVYTKHAIRYKAAEYLLKPVDPNELNEALQKCKTEWETAARERHPWPLNIGVAFALTPHKQLLRWRFNELNADGVRAAFRQLGEEWKRNQLDKPPALEGFIREMLLFLKELLIENALETDGYSFAAAPDAWSSCENAVAFLAERYTHALEQLIQQRKFKNKLNLEEVRHYIERHFAEPISLEQVAKAFFVSKEYLSKVFKQEYGCTVTDHILHLRMEKARKWLSDESIPIKAVAEMAGYEDVTYFYRVFKKHFGISPGEMRKKQV